MFSFYLKEARHVAYVRGALVVEQANSVGLSDQLQVVGDQEHGLVAQHGRRAQTLVENVVGHLVSEREERKIGGERETPSS